MSDKFDKAMEFTSKAEGGFTNDSGGKTNFGITQQTLDQYQEKMGRKMVSVNDINPEYAKKIAKDMFFDRVGLDILPEKVAIAVFDYGFNSGPSRAIKDLQRVVGTKPDGIIGRKTVSAIDGYIARNGEEQLISKIMGSRRNNYSRLVKSSPQKYGQYAQGWENRVSGLEQYLSVLDASP